MWLQCWFQDDGVMPWNIAIFQCVKTMSLTVTYSNYGQVSGYLAVTEKPRLLKITCLAVICCPPNFTLPCWQLKKKTNLNFFLKLTRYNFLRYKMIPIVFKRKVKHTSIKLRRLTMSKQTNSAEMSVTLACTCR